MGSRPPGREEAADATRPSVIQESTRKKAENKLRFLKTPGFYSLGSHGSYTHQVSSPYGFPAHGQTMHQALPTPHPRVRSTNNCQQTGVSVITQDLLQASDGSLHLYQPLRLSLNPSYCPPSPTPGAKGEKALPVPSHPWE